MNDVASSPLRVAVLVKQVPLFEAFTLGPDGRLCREGLELEMNPYCRRAVAKGVSLARQSGGRCTVITLGPPVAEDVLREAIAWGADEGLLVSDPAFAGSDTLATARALAAALTAQGPFDLILVGRNSVDADTGQVGPELAELLDLPFLAAVRELEIEGEQLLARCETDDGWLRATTSLPAVVSTAERLCDPAKVDPPGRAAVAAERIRRASAADLGPGPWGTAGSPTTVGEVRAVTVERRRILLGGTPAEQVATAVGLLSGWGALAGSPPASAGRVPPSSGGGERAIGVVVDEGRCGGAPELLGAAAGLAAAIGGRVVALTGGVPDPPALSAMGADEVVVVEGAKATEDVARAVTEWAKAARPWAVLSAATLPGREVAARVAAALGAGLTGDAIRLSVEHDRLVAWKPAFGGGLEAAITARSEVQMATVRPGVLPALTPRAPAAPAVTVLTMSPRGRVAVLEQVVDDDPAGLASALVVVGVGMGVDPADYGRLDPLLHMLGAELAATRKVTDRGWLPRSRQVGITGHSVSPRLYVSLGVGGRFNHMVGVRAAGTVLAVNTDPDALVFGACDVGVVGDWREVVTLLVDELAGQSVHSRSFQGATGAVPGLAPRPYQEQT